MPSKTQKNRQSRRAFLGTVTAGAASLALVPGEKPGGQSRGG